jgi:hypothetical protein
MRAHTVRCGFIVGARPCAGWRGTGARVAPDEINAATFNAGKKPEAMNIKAQVLLDRARFSPGAIDGRRGENFSNALRAFQEQNRLKASGRARRGDLGEARAGCRACGG